MSLFGHRESRTNFFDADPHQWDLSSSPSRKVSISSKHPKTVIPDPAIFCDAIVPAFEHRERGTPMQYPTPGHLAVHLALIECFLKLKETVATSSRLEILDVPKYPQGSGNEKSLVLPNVAQMSERWKTVVRLAVSRFQIWFENVEAILRHASAYHRYGPNSPATHAAITADYLPPLDVLLVWYVYMNHPGAYREDNLAHSSPKLLEIPLPWEAILAATDMDTLTYTMTPAAEKLFITTTTQSPDILVYLSNPPPYSDLNPETAFSIDLSATVHALVDGASFMPKMHSLLWLRSPSLEGTLGRALARYAALPQATGARPSAWFTRVLNDPALELVWRSHMVYPMAYARYSQEIFGSDALLIPEAEDEFQAPSNKTASTEINATITSDGSSLDDEDDGAMCYCDICERIRDEEPNYIYIPPSNADMDPPRAEADNGPSRPRSSIFSRSSSKPSGYPPELKPLLNLTKDQISDIKADVSFYRQVEAFRQSNPTGTPLPTRPPSTRAIAKQKQEQESKDRAGRYYGLGYSVEVIRPAVYDKVTGKLLKKEKTRVKKLTTGYWGVKFGWI